MDINLALKKIRTQIKYGRGIEATKALRILLTEYENTENEKTILEVLALEALKKRGAYKEAIPILQRLLDLNISENTRMQAFEFLALSIEQENLLPSDPDILKKEFVEFMRTIRDKELFKSSKIAPTFSEYFLVENIELAESLAWKVETEPPFQSWYMLRTQASKEVYRHYFIKKINMNPVENNVLIEIAEICDENLSPTMMNFYDDILSDLSLMAMGQLVGVIPDLHVKMWRAYQDKCYPCGWRGNYPEGKLCVYPNT